MEIKSRKLWDKIYEFAVMHDFDPPKIKRPLTSRDLRTNCQSDKNYDYIKDFNDGT